MMEAIVLDTALLNNMRIDVGAMQSGVSLTKYGLAYENVKLLVIPLILFMVIPILPL